MYAYSNGELRGKTTPVEFPLTGELVFSLMVYGDWLNQEVLNFELYDYETNNYYPIEQKLNFSKDMIVGDALDPFYFEGESTTPSEFKLSPAYPNPFNPSTTITYSISEPEIVKLSVYDITGREVEILENNHKDSGSHTMLWDAAGFASGIYYIQLTAGNQIETQKVMLVK